MQRFTEVDCVLFLKWIWFFWFNFNRWGRSGFCEWTVLFSVGRVTIDGRRAIFQCGDSDCFVGFAETEEVPLVVGGRVFSESHSKLFELGPLGAAVLRRVPLHRRCKGRGKGAGPSQMNRPIDWPAKNSAGRVVYYTLWFNNPCRRRAHHPRMAEIEPVPIELDAVLVQWKSNEAISRIDLRQRLGDTPLHQSQCSERTHDSIHGQFSQRFAPSSNERERFVKEISNNLRIQEGALTRTLS